MAHTNGRDRELLRRFGATVRHQRRRLGLTQQQLADGAGLQRTYLADVERGVRNLALTQIVKFAAAAGMPLSTFIAPMPRVVVPAAKPGKSSQRDKRNRSAR